MADKEEDKAASVLDWDIHLDEEVRFVTSEGDPQLKLVFWTRDGASVPASAGRRIAFWHPGIGEHVARYRHVAAALLHRVPALDAVVSYDMRNHGGSGGARGKIEDVSDIESDVRGRVFPAMADRFGQGIRVALMGHSLGGLVVASVASVDDFLQRDELGEVVAVFLSAPAVEPAVPGIVNRLLLPIAHAVAGVPFMKTVCKPSDIRGEQITHDEKVVKLYDEGDGELYVSTGLLLHLHSALMHSFLTILSSVPMHFSRRVNQVSIGLATSMMRKGTTVLNAVKENTNCCLRSDVPVMIAHGEQDSLVLPSGSRNLVDAIGHNVELLMIPLARHEMHCETVEHGREVFFSKLAAFLEKAFE